MEVKHRCNQVLELGFPLGGLAKLFAQDWEGDVTVVMPATLAQVCNVSYCYGLTTVDGLAERPPDSSPSSGTILGSSCLITINTGFSLL